MAKKIMGFKTKGMNRDLSVSAFNPEFAFENVNLRISTNEGNTLMSWVNEKGTRKITLSTELKGTPLGTAVLNHQLVLFTHSNETKPDYIYKLSYSNSSKTAMNVVLLYNGNLNFSTANPIETLAYYEADNIQKIYWTDGINQPRLINIAETAEKRESKWTDTSFDFVPAFKMGQASEKLTVKRVQSSTGLFAPGVIQYCFTYINKYSQQSNIVSVSPINYITLNDRGASPEEKVTTGFTIKIENTDSHFDYIRIYSIQRTSLDAVPIVKLVLDIPVEDTIEFTDNGTIGTNIDPTELLFVGGKEISAYTLADKDNTLFLGNIQEKKPSIKEIQDYFNNKRDIGAHSVEYVNDNPNKEISVDSSDGSVYRYTNMTAKYDAQQMTTFKGGETYRFGFQLQKNTGEWSDPIFIEDRFNGKYPITSDTSINLISAYASIFPNSIPGLDLSIYKRIRPLIVYPTMGERNVVCQGVLNPTVFNVKDRLHNSPFSQASWFFRPFVWDIENTETEPEEGVGASFVHYSPLYTEEEAASIEDVEERKRAYRRIEIQGSINEYDTPHAHTHHSEVNSNTQFFVDQSIVTLNSPDIDFDTNVQNCNIENLKLRIIGAIPITGNVSSHDIKTTGGMVDLYHLNVDTKSTFPKYGVGELDTNVLYKNISENAGKRLVSEYIWNDSLVYPAVIDKNLDVEAAMNPFNYLVYPWHREGSMNTDQRNLNDASSVLSSKKEATLLFSNTTKYFTENRVPSPEYPINMQICLFENSNVVNTRIKKQGDSFSDINYYANVDKVLYNENGYDIYALDNSETDSYDERYYDESYKIEKTYSPISMRFKSTSHAIVALSEEDGSIPVLPMARYGSSTVGSLINQAYGDTFWGDSILFKQDTTNLGYVFDEKYDFLWMGEIVRDNSDNDLMFGGTSEAAIRSNTWLIGGEEVDLFNANGEAKTYVDLVWEYGDTYFQRYDCLKTYPFTNEDSNQLVEILSFMCETHVNVDGRYDRNRGQMNNVNIRPETFNMLNPAYSQSDNFFQARKINDSDISYPKYPNLVYYSKTKEAGADVDMYTNVTLANILQLEGTSGKISSLQLFNNQLLAFQDTGISHILYNENVQISSTDGVPIEIANSQKVLGARYVSNTVGCSNKWSIVNTLTGLYFIDNNTKDIYGFNGQLTNISQSRGFNSWCKNNISSPNINWNPVDFQNTVSFYDRLNQDVLFVNGDTALAFSEKLSVFSSFYDYGSTPFFCNLEDTGVWVRKDGSLWKHQAGDYCRFFGTLKPYSMTLVGNPEPQMDKIFTNLEFRACVDYDGMIADSKFVPYLPFDYLETWNEYQHGITQLKNRDGSSAFKHHTSDGISSLKRKFRIWRCDIPRDNAPLSADSGMNISRVNPRPIDRMRNPWLYLKLKKNEESSNRRAEIHDILMTYFE